MKWSEPNSRYGISPSELLLAAALALGSVFALLIWTSIAAAMFSALLIFTMLIVMVTDSRRMLIPDILSLPATPAGLLASAICLPGDWKDVVIDHAAAAGLGAAAFYGLRWIYLKRRGVVGLGLGDVKLVAATGAWVGLEYLPVTLLLASCSGLAAALLRRYRSGTAKLEPQSAVPLGSFIAPATVMFWILLLPGR